MRTRLLIPFGLLIALGMLLSACGASANTGVQAASLPISDTANLMVTADLPVNAQGQPIAAKVNDAEITIDQFNRALARYEQQQLAASDVTTARTTVLNTLIDQTLIEQAAMTQSVTVTDADVQAELDESMGIAGSPEAWQQWLAANLYTEDEFRATLYDTLITSRMRDILTQGLDGNVAQVHARHILVATEVEATGILERLNAGEDFAALAAAYSRDVTTRAQGGDLGWFAQDALLEPYLAEVAFSLQPGQLSGAVPTSLGFHVIQVLERAEQPIPEAERANLAQNRFEVWLASLRSSATIERYL